LPLDPDKTPQEVHIGDLQTERFTDPQTRPGEQHRERPIVRLDGVGQSCDLLDGRDNDLWPIVAWQSNPVTWRCPRIRSSTAAANIRRATV